MRVAQVDLHVTGGDPDARLDAHTTTVELARAVQARGLELEVFLAAEADATRFRDGIRYAFVADGALPRRLARALARFAPDVVHLHGLGRPRGLLYLRARLGRRVALYAQDHGSRLPPLAASPVYALAYRGLDAVSFTARAQASPFFARRLFARSLPVHEVVEGSSRFRPGDREAARAATGLEGDPAVLSVGHLDANKDPLTVLRGFAGALEARPGMRLIMVYRRAPLLGEVERFLAARPALASRVRLLGPVPHEELERFYAAADLFVSASRSEGSGYALLEAMATGLTPVVSRIPSFTAIAGGLGGAFEVGDAAGLTEALLRTRPPPSEVRARFERALSFEAIGRQLEAVYRAASTRR